MSLSSTSINRKLNVSILNTIADDTKIGGTASLAMDRARIQSNLER